MEAAYRGAVGRINLPLALFAAAVVASGVVLLIWQSHLTFFFDDWDPLLDRRGFSAHAVLRPHVDHIIISTTLIYKAIQATFGMESLVPYSIVSISTFLVSVVLLFVYLRRRAGEWLALAGVLPILFLGGAHEDLLWPYQIFFFGAMAAGLGALLVLERGDRRGDALACALLVLSFTFSELALPFVLGVATAIALDRGPIRRAYVVAVPLLFYAVWYLGWGHTAQSQFSFDNVANSVTYVLNGMAAGVASLLGLTDSAFTDTGGLGWGRPLLLVLFVVAAIRLRSWVSIPPAFWVTLVILLSFWFLTALNAGIGRPATASRYQYIGAILILLVAAELARGVRPSPLAIAIALAIAGAAALGGISILHQSYRFFADLTPSVRGGLAGLEIAADRVSPDLVLNQENSDVNYLNAIRAGPYLSAVDKFGSPAYTDAELSTAPERARVAADKVLGTGLGIVDRQLSRAPSPSGPAPMPLGPSAAKLRQRGSCLTVRTKREPAVVSLPRGGAILEVPRGGRAALMLRRFASAFSINGGTVRGISRLDIPLDRSARPWQLQIDSASPVTVCGSGLPFG